MQWRRYLWHLLFLTLTWLSGAQSSIAEEFLRVGVAEADITPPQGFLVAGYYHERRATGTIDPLKARAMVVRTEHVQAAIVTCDLTDIAADLTCEVRRRASARTGIPAEHVILTATHSHTAPDYTKDLYDYLGTSGEAVGNDRNNRPYAAKLVGGIVDAIANAHAAAEPAVLEAGTARQETPVSFNRRFLIRDGSVRTWMSLDNPDVLRAAGPIDPDMGLMLVRSASG